MSAEISDILTIETMFGSIAFLMAITACTAGVSWRTYIKWKDKVDAGENIPFDSKFIYQAIGVLVGAFSVAYPMTHFGIEQINAYAGQIGLIGAWVLTAAWAYALNDGTNGIIKKIEGRAVTTAVKSGKLDEVINQRVDKILKSKGVNEE